MGSCMGKLCRDSAEKELLAAESSVRRSQNKLNTRILHLGDQRLELERSCRELAGRGDKTSLQRETRKLVALRHEVQHTERGLRVLNRLSTQHDGTSETLRSAMLAAREMASARKRASNNNDEGGVDEMDAAMDDIGDALYDKDVTDNSMHDAMTGLAGVDDNDDELDTETQRVMNQFLRDANGDVDDEEVVLDTTLDDIARDRQRAREEDEEDNPRASLLAQIQGAPRPPSSDPHDPKGGGSDDPPPLRVIKGA